jgi:hypothetical protein
MAVFAGIAFIAVVYICSRRGQRAGCFGDNRG